MAKTDDTKHVITVFLLDDHELVRVGVKDFLETQPDIRVSRSRCDGGISGSGMGAAYTARIAGQRPGSPGSLAARLSGVIGGRRTAELTGERGDERAGGLVTDRGRGAGHAVS
jgi:hypothetical protein